MVAVLVVPALAEAVAGAGAGDGVGAGAGACAWAVAGAEAEAGAIPGVPWATRTGCMRSCPTRPLTIWANEVFVPSPAPCRAPETGGPPGWEGRACGGVGRAITTRVGAVGKPGTCCPAAAEATAATMA